LFVAVGAYVLAALFAERREGEAHLARANMSLERERDNKLMSAQAIAGPPEADSDPFRDAHLSR
jgi:hypothetical protein